MRVDPALRSFARDRAAIAGAQGRLHAAKEQWRTRADVAAVLADCEAFASGACFAECSALDALLTGGAAPNFVHGWMEAMLGAWRNEPLAQVPFRHSVSRGMATIQLHRTGPVSLSLLVIESAPDVLPKTISFTDCERHEVVLAGSGRAIAYRSRESAPPSGSPLLLAPGTRFDGHADLSRAIIALDAPLVLLRVVRDPVHPEPTRQVEIATGRVLHRASASPAEGRAELAAALLGAMGRTDAARPLADYACGKAGAGARWQALRNALALDTATGFAALCRIADRPDDPVVADAAALLGSLCTTYPQLANLREELCLAS